jgi:hypothetical protein
MNAIKMQIHKSLYFHYHFIDRLLFFLRYFFSSITTTAESKEEETTTTTTNGFIEITITTTRTNNI